MRIRQFFDLSSFSLRLFKTTVVNRDLNVVNRALNYLVVAHERLTEPLATIEGLSAKLNSLSDTPAFLVPYGSL